MVSGRGPSTPALIAFCGPCLPLSAIGLPLVVHLPAYYAGHIGLPLGAVGLAFTFVRLIDIGVDPLVGGLMDRTRSRFGRFRVWLALSAPVLMLAAWMLFMARPGVGALYLWAWLGVAYAGFSMGSLSQMAWGAVLSPDYDQRSRIYGFWQTGNVLGMILVLSLPPLLSIVWKAGEAAGVAAMGWFIIVLMPVTILVAVWRVGEPALPPLAAHGRIGDYLALLRTASVARLVVVDLLMGWAPGVTGILYLFYFDQVKHTPRSEADILLLVFFVSALVFGPAWSALAVRIGKHRALAFTCLLLIAGELLVLVVPFRSLLLALAVMGAAGASYSGGPLLVRAMMADAADEVRLQTGRDRTGLLYALLTATTKIGYALAGLSFVALDLAGFRRDGVNGPGALLWLQILFVGVPSVLSLAAAAVVARHSLDARRHGQILAGLAARDLALSRAALAE